VSLPLGKIPGSLSWPQGLSAAGRIKSIKIPTTQLGIDSATYHVAIY
jgi:hypothetical protein